MRIPEHTRILLMATDERSSREYGIGRRMVLALLALLAVTGLLLTALLVAFALQSREVRELRLATVELDQARREAGQVRALSRELEQMRSFQERLLVMLGVRLPAARDSGEGLLATAATTGPADLTDLPRPAGPIGTTGPATGDPHAPGLTDDRPARALGGVHAAAGFSGILGSVAGRGTGIVAGHGAGDLAGDNVGAFVPGSTDDRLGRASAVVVSPPPDLWPARGYVTREFIVGQPNRGIVAHQGLDIAARGEAPVRAAGGGVVYRIGEDPYLGNFVEIQHGLGYLTVYGHCSRTMVERGRKVERGQVIAYVGDTGEASAPHLHFEIWRDGEAIDP
ncbi:MAG: M23 family metallopeptidase, partial [Candidatus Krumholzibacteriia bacterium]